MAPLHPSIRGRANPLDGVLLEVSSKYKPRCYRNPIRHPPIVVVVCLLAANLIRVIGLITIHTYDIVRCSLIGGIYNISIAFGSQSVSQTPSAASTCSNIITKHVVDMLIVRCYLFRIEQQHFHSLSPQFHIYNLYV